MYGEEELDSGNIKDKEAKVAYLSKLVACVGICKGQAIDVKAAKVPTSDVEKLEKHETRPFPRARC